MEMHEIIEQAEQNIRQALNDYGAYTSQTEVLDDVSDEFIHRLAEDSSRAKQPLRELFSKSPVWDEKIDALVINGTRTHNPDYGRIRSLANFMLYDKIRGADKGVAGWLDLAIGFFCNPQGECHDDSVEQLGIEAIKKLAPKAYAPGKKLSRVFKALCKELGVADETAGSDFQRYFAEFADELTSKKIGFKLYVSINPAHFLTMSNPKNDRRGCTLTSCHSFNSTEYEYNNGCVGYARDDVSFIVFTVDDPSNPETLNNRKTTRQIFAYKPGNGLLMQSRMYNTSGGTRGAQEESKLYRDLVQREISLLEGAVNLWKTHPYCSEGHYDWVRTGYDFGGYADWTYSEFDGKVSLRIDHEDDFEPLTVGEAGLCVRCACELSKNLYCDDCDESYVCDDCGCRCSDTHRVLGDDGYERYVCEDCRDENYTYCDECEEYHPNNNVTYVDGCKVCDDCLDEYYEECDECGEYHRRDDMTDAVDGHGNDVRVCEACLDDNYFYCEDCGTYYHNDCGVGVYRTDGYVVLVCDDCADEYDRCPHCDELIKMREDRTCPACGAVVEEDDEEVETA